MPGQRCDNDNGTKAPALQLKSSKAKTPGTKYGKYMLIDTPLKGRFFADGPECIAFAFSCIGDGNYSFAELVVVDANGQQMATTPPTVNDAIYPVAGNHVLRPATWPRPEGTMILRRSGNDVRFQQGYSDPRCS
jgi:hypothetical protein